MLHTMLVHTSGLMGACGGVRVGECYYLQTLGVHRLDVHAPAYELYSPKPGLIVKLLMSQYKLFSAERLDVQAYIVPIVCRKIG